MFGSFIYVLPLGKLLSIISSIFVLRLIFEHAAHFRVPACQRKIIGILWMVPIYTAHSIIAFDNLKVQLVADLFRDSFEAFMIYMFFSLTICILCESEGGQLDATHLQRLLQHIKRDPRWLLMVKRCILQYSAIRVIITALGVILAVAGFKDEGIDPFSPFIYMTIILFVSCSLALHYLYSWYQHVKEDEQFKGHRIGLKFIGIKLIIFISFWQSVTVSFATEWILSDRTHIPETLGEILQVTAGTPLEEDLCEHILVWLNHLVMSYCIPIFATILLYAYPLEVYLADYSPRHVQGFSSKVPSSMAGTVGGPHIHRRLISSPTGDIHSGVEDVECENDICYIDDDANTSGSIATPGQTRFSVKPHPAEYFGFRDTFHDIKLLFREPRTNASIFNFYQSGNGGDPNENTTLVGELGEGQGGTLGASGVQSSSTLNQIKHT